MADGSKTQRHTLLAGPGAVWSFCGSQLRPRPHPSIAMKFHWWVFSPVVFPWTGQAQQAGTVTPEECLERVGTGGRNIHSNLV